jgi:hypothetical protein
MLVTMGSTNVQDAKERPTSDGWRQLHKTEASMQGGKIACESSAALRVNVGWRSTTVFGNVAAEESISSTLKCFRFVYDGITADGKPAVGAVELPEDFWKLDTVKIRSDNAKARLLLMRFAGTDDDDLKELQLTVPISNHKESKQSKALVDSIMVYGTHYVSNKEICVGKKTLGCD